MLLNHRSLFSQLPCCLRCSCPGTASDGRCWNLQRSYFRSTVHVWVTCRGTVYPYIPSNNILIFRKTDSVSLHDCVCVNSTSWIPGWSQVYVAKNRTIFWTFTLAPGCWDYNHIPLHWVDRLLGIKSRALCMLSKHWQLNFILTQKLCCCQIEVSMFLSLREHTTINKLSNWW